MQLRKKTAAKETATATAQPDDVAYAIVLEGEDTAWTPMTETSGAKVIQLPDGFQAEWDAGTNSIEPSEMEPVALLRVAKKKPRLYEGKALHEKTRQEKEAEREAKKVEQAEIAERLKEDPPADRNSFGSEPRFYWTMRGQDGFYCSGIERKNADGAFETVTGATATHKLRREAKARALALYEGYQLGNGTSPWNAEEN
jgi:hypothetical protein